MATTRCYFDITIDGKNAGRIVMECQMSKRQYSPDRLLAAVACVKRSKHSISEVSRDFGIPRKTLADHVNGRYEQGSTYGPKAILDEDEEKTLMNYMRYLARQGFPLTRDMVRKFILAMYSKSGRPIPFNKASGPSNKWFRKLMTRHPDLKESAPETQSRARARMANPNVMDEYFMRLSDTVDRLGLAGHPDQIFNCDETGWSSKDKSTGKVFGVKGEHTYQQTMSSSGHITAHMCICADGHVLPTFLIFEKCLPRSSYKDGAPGNWMFASSATGYMDTELFILWFKQLFLPSCGSKRPVLLVLDNLDAHVSLEFLSVARANNIEVLGLPPHTTHIVQPLDVSIMGPLKSKFNEIANNVGFLSKHQVLNKASFPVVLSYAVDQCLTASRVKGSFRKSGLFPVDRKAIDESQLVKSHIAPKSSSPHDPEQQAAATPCPSCGNFIGVNPLVSEGLVPERLADIFTPVPCKPKQSVSRKLVTEARVLTCDDFYRKLEEKEAEAVKRKEEVEKRKKEREERKAEKERKQKEKPKKEKKAGKEKKTEKEKKAGKEKKTQKEETETEQCIDDKEICMKCRQIEPEGVMDFLWVSCETCDQWFHTDCVGLGDIAIEELEDTYFLCEMCCLLG